MKDLIKKIGNFLALDEWGAILLAAAYIVVYLQTEDSTALVITTVLAIGAKIMWSLKRLHLKLDVYNKEKLNDLIDAKIRARENGTD